MSARAARQSKVLKKAMMHASEALSLTVAYRFKPRGVDVSFRDPLALPELWRGREETPVCAAFYEVRGDLSGYLLLVFSFADMEELARALLGEEHGDEAMIDSALGELGNIVGSSFLNYLADHLRISAAPTPPQVVRDMMGAVLESVAAAVAAEGKSEVPVIQTRFTQDERSVDGFLLWITDAEAIQRLGAN